MTSDVKTQTVGILGTFQAGKSTLINCLLQDRLAICGNGCVTTRKLVRYRYAPLAHVLPRAAAHPSAEEKRKLSDLPEIFEDRKYGAVDICLPNPLLKELVLLDSPGFSANPEDTAVAEACIAEMDCGIWLIGGEVGDIGEAGREVAKRLREAGRPVVVVFNCNSFTERKWNPQSKENLVLRGNLAADIALNLGNGVWPIGQDDCPEVLGINAAWAWHCCRKRIRKPTLPDPATSFEWEDYVPPSWDDEELERDSNLWILRNFLDPKSAEFGGLFWKLRLEREQTRFREELKKNILLTGE